MIRDGRAQGRAEGRDRDVSPDATCAAAAAAPGPRAAAADKVRRRREAAALAAAGRAGAVRRGTDVTEMVTRTDSDRATRKAARHDGPEGARRCGPAA